MALTVKHFDTKLKQDTDISETLNNTLAEYLFPGTEFAIGVVYPEGSTAKDLGEYEGKTLQFSSGQRMYFASSEVRDLVYPNPSDGAAYGSLPFTPNKTFQEKTVRVLVVDDATGENGGMMPTDAARRLVGDCYGKVSREIAQDLTGKTNTPFQFRMGIKPQAENDVYRIAKGTLCPANLDFLSDPFIRSGLNFRGDLVTKTGYDMVLATSSFKGRKGEQAIKPGEYYLTVGIGMKAEAEFRAQSLGTQVLRNYWRGVQADILPQLKDMAEDLADIRSDPRLLAQYYIEKYERRQAFLGKTVEREQLELGLDELGSVIDGAFGIENSDDNSAQQERQDLLLYKLLKADLESGHCQLIDGHPKIIEELEKFAQREAVDIATGRAIKFKAGLAQPSLSLKPDEMCDITIPEGKEIICYRSPTVNSNGVIVLKNKHIPEAKGLKGVLFFNPQKEEEIQKETGSSQRVHTAVESLQMDFDGDYAAIALAEDYPVLAEEVKERNLPQNRYPDIVKATKIPYEANNFAEIAMSARENKIGLIANQMDKAETLQWETQLIPDELKEEYLVKVAGYYQKLLKEDADPNKHLQIPDKFKERLSTVASFKDARDKYSRLGEPVPPKILDTNLSIIKSIQFDVVSDLGNELQTAVDGPKSAARPKEEVLAYCFTLSDYPAVAWVKDKKNSLAYIGDTVIRSTNYSPIDLMVQQANEIYSASQLERRAASEFQNMFAAIPFTLEQKECATEIRDTYNQYVKRAKEIEDKIETEIGPSLIATSAKSGKKIEITNLLKYDHPAVWSAKHLDIKLVENSNPTSKIPHKLLAIAFYGTLDENGRQVWKRLGTVSESSVTEHKLTPSTMLKGATIELIPGATKTQVKGLLNEANQYLEEVRQNTDPSEEAAMFSAIWHVSHTKDDSDSNYSKKAGVAFSAFPNQLLKQLSDLKSIKLTVVGLHQPTNEHLGRKWNGEKVSIEVALETDPNNGNFGKRIIIADGKKLAQFKVGESQTLPIGTKAQAEIISPPITSVIATTAKGNTLKITQIKNYNFAEQEWNGESKTIEIGFTPVKNEKSGKEYRLPVAKVEGKILGIIDKESAQKLREANLLKTGQLISASLETAPATFAHLQVDMKTIVYPETWTRVAMAWSRQSSEEAELSSDRTKKAVTPPADQREETAPTQNFDAPSEHQPSHPTPESELSATEEAALTSRALSNFATQTIPQASKQRSAERGTDESTLPAEMTPKRDTRPDWERKLIQVAFSQLQANRANRGKDLQFANLPQGYKVVYYTKDNTLQIFDSKNEERGTIYKARRGQPASINQLSLAEQQLWSTASVQQGKKQRESEVSR